MADRFIMAREFAWIYAQNRAAQATHSTFGTDFIHEISVYHIFFNIILAALNSRTRRRIFNARIADARIAAE